jgi:hypothetical protein
MNGTIECTCTIDLLLVRKKKVTATVASMSSMEAFPTVGLALQLEVPTAAVASIRGWKVGRSARTLSWMAGWRLWWPVSTLRQRWWPVGGCPAMGDPLHGITVGGHV